MTTNAKLIALDIETIPTQNERIAARVREAAILKDPASNTKKELKAVWHSEQSRNTRAEEAYRKTAVDVLLAEPVCVCLEDGWDKLQFPLRYMGEDPGAAVGRLAEMNEALEALACEESVWIGHNITGFDLSVLLNTFRRYGLKPPTHFPSYHLGRWRGRVYDTMTMAPGGNGLGMVRMSALCEAYGLDEPKCVLWQGEPMNGSRVYDAYLNGDTDLITEYCATDVTYTLELYDVMTVGEQWGTYQSDDGLREAIAEIENSDLTEAQQAMAIVNLLRRNNKLAA